MIIAVNFPIGKFTAMITFHFHLQPQYKYELFHVNFTSCHCTGRYELNKLTSLPMCGFIAQLVEHRTGIAEVTGSNPVEALIFSGFFFPIAQIGKFTAMITFHFHLQPQYKYELFHINFTSVYIQFFKASDFLSNFKIYFKFSFHYNFK